MLKHTHTMKVLWQASGGEWGVEVFPGRIRTIQSGNAHMQLWAQTMANTNSLVVFFFLRVEMCDFMI